MAGYSNKPTWQKLEIKQGDRVMIINEPRGYTTFLGDDCPGYSKVAQEGGTEIDMLHLFVTDRDELSKNVPLLLWRVRGGGRVWVSWPKSSSKIPSSIKEKDIRGVVLPLGWMDTKVCAVSDDWSGLKFMRRSIA